MGLSHAPAAVVLFGAGVLGCGCQTLDFLELFITNQDGGKGAFQQQFSWSCQTSTAFSRYLYSPNSWVIVIHISCSWLCSIYLFIYLWFSPGSWGHLGSILTYKNSFSYFSKKKGLSLFWYKNWNSCIVFHKIHFFCKLTEDPKWMRTDKEGNWIFVLCVGQFVHHVLIKVVCYL